MNPSPAGFGETAKRAIAEEVQVSVTEAENFGTLGLLQSSHPRSGLHQPVPGGDNAFFVTQQGHVHGQEKLSVRAGSMWGRGDHSASGSMVASVALLAQSEELQEDQPPRQWDKEFQDAYSLPVVDMALEIDLNDLSPAHEEYSEKKKLFDRAAERLEAERKMQIESVVCQFENMAVQIVERLIEERNCERRTQSIRPLNHRDLPHVFIHRNIFYHSLCEDRYKDHAHKAARAELKNLRFLYEQRISGLHVPLCSIIHCCGFKYFVSAVVHGLHENRRIYGLRTDREHFVKLTSDSSASEGGNEVSINQANGHPARILRQISNTFMLTEPDILRSEEKSLPPFLDDGVPERSRSPGLQHQPSWVTVKVIGPPDLSLFSFDEDLSSESSGVTPASKRDNTIRHRMYCFNVSSCFPSVAMEQLTPLNPVLRGALSLSSGKSVVENTGLFSKPSPHFLKAAMELYPGLRIPTSAGLPWASGEEKVVVNSATEWVAIDQVQVVADLLRCWPLEDSKFSGPLLKEVLHLHGVNLCFMGAVYRCLMSETKREIEARVDDAALRAFFPKVPSEDERLANFPKKAPPRRGFETKAAVRHDETLDTSYVPPIVGLGAQGLGGGPMTLKPSSKFEDPPAPSPYLPHSPEAKNPALCIGEKSSRRRSENLAGKGKTKVVDTASGPSSPLSPRTAQLEKTPQVLAPAPPPALSDQAPSTARSMRGSKFPHHQQSSGASTARVLRTNGHSGGQDEPVDQGVQLVPAKITLREDGEVLTTLRVEIIARSFRSILEEQIRSIVSPKREDKTSTPQKRKRGDTSFAQPPNNNSSPASQVSRLLSELKALEDICLSEQSPQARVVSGRTFTKGSDELTKMSSPRGAGQLDKSGSLQHQQLFASPSTTTGRAIAVSSVLASNPVYCRDEESRFLGLAEPTMGDCARDRVVLLLNRLLGDDRGSRYFWQSVLLPEAWSRYQDLGSSELFLKLPKSLLCDRVCQLCGIDLSERTVQRLMMMDHSVAANGSSSSGSVGGSAQPLTIEDVVALKPVVKSLLRKTDFDVNSFLPEKKKTSTTNNLSRSTTLDAIPRALSSTKGGHGVQVLQTLEKVIQFAAAFHQASSKRNEKTVTALPSQVDSAFPKPLEMTPRENLFAKNIPASTGEGSSYDLSKTESHLLSTLSSAEAKVEAVFSASSRSPQGAIQQLEQVAVTLRELVSLYTYGGSSFETDLILSRKKLVAAENQIVLQNLKQLWEQRGLDGPVYTLCKDGVFINSSQASEHVYGSGAVERIVDKDPTAMLKTMPILSGTPDRKPVDFKKVAKKLEDEWSKREPNEQSQLERSRFAPPGSPGANTANSEYVLIPQYQCFKCGQLVRAYSLPEHKCEVVTEHRHIDRGIHPVGLGNGTLSDINITASSCAYGTKPSFARLGLGAPRGWQPKTTNVEKEWIQIRLPVKRTVHAVAVSGDACGRYPRYFILEHSLDGVTWQRYKSPYKHWETPVALSTNSSAAGMNQSSSKIEPPIAATTTSASMFSSPEETLAKVRSTQSGGRLSLSGEEKELLLINPHHMENPRTQRVAGQAPSWQRNRAHEEFHLGQLLIPVKVVDEQENAHLPNSKSQPVREKVAEKRVPCALAGCTSANTVSFNELRVPVEARFVRLLIGSDASMADEPNEGLSTRGGSGADQNRVAVTLEIFCSDIDPIEQKAHNTRWSEQIPLRCVDWQRPVVESSKGTRLDLAKTELALLRQIIQLESRIEKTGGAKAKLVTELQEANHTWRNLLASWGAERQGDLDKQKKLHRKTK